ncbi:MAG: hypothetical protein AAGA21_12585 [Pseudomonadota bacterium]
MVTKAGKKKDEHIWILKRTGQNFCSRCSRVSQPAKPAPERRRWHLSHQAVVNAPRMPGARWPIRKQSFGYFSYFWFFMRKFSAI